MAKCGMRMRNVTYGVAVGFFFGCLFAFVRYGASVRMMSQTRTFLILSRLWFPVLDELHALGRGNKRLTDLDSLSLRVSILRRLCNGL